MKTQLPRRASRLAAAGTSAAMVATALVAFSPVGPAHAAATSQTFNYLNEAQTFIVPSETQTLSVTAYGAAGGNAGSPGGQGGMTKATINVAGKSSLSVNVGGKGGGTVGGFNGGASGGTGRASGAGGGGATDIRYSGTRLLVAPGGGGGGGNSRIHTGGKGGTGSQAGTAGVVGGGGKNAGAGGAAATQASGVGTSGGNGQSRRTGSGGGGGGGGGGYKAGSGGGGGKSPLVGIAGAGGGGGSGSAYVVTGATNVSYASGGSGGNGIATLSWIDITTDSLPDGQVSQPYVGQLSAVGNSGAMTWSVTSGTLPLGLSLDASTGAISGVPTTQEVTTAAFSVSDTQGKISTVSITFDIHASNAIVVDGPATNITQTTATGNATVTPDGINAVTAIYCRISTSSTMSPYTQVDAATPPVPLSAGAGPTAATCPFTGLVANTKYYYVAYAVDSSVNSSNKPSVFTTTPKANQTADIAPPAFIKPLGVTVLMAKSTRTNDGQKVEVLTSRVLKPRPRGDVRPWYRMVYLASGGVAVRTYDRGPFYFRVVYRAPGDATYNPWQYVRTYLVK